MKTVPLPPFTARDTYRTCISRVRKIELRNRLNNIEGDIVAAANTYRNRIATAELYRIPAQVSVGAVSVKEMKAVYTGRMAHTNGPGRGIYDALMIAAPDGFCPLCNVGRVKTLDHHLAKDLHPALAVAPLNLVPACRDCNFDKATLNPTCSQDQTLNPYFDNIEGDTWLHAQVVPGPPTTIHFSIVAPLGANAVLAARVQHHFEVYGLQSIYGPNAGRKLTGMKNHIVNLHAAGGDNEVRAHLQEAMNSAEAADRNSWETAMFRALYNSAWYYSGGFSE